MMQRSNWKVFFENLNDTGHPIATHESSYKAARQYSNQELDGEMPFQLHIIDGNGEPPEFWANLDLHAFEFGHSYMTAIFKAPNDPLSQAYFASLAAAKGEDTASEILSVSRHNTIIYPSCSLIPRSSSGGSYALSPLTERWLRFLPLSWRALRLNSYSEPLSIRMSSIVRRLL